MNFNLGYSKLERYRILWHILFWVSYLSFFSILYGSWEGKYLEEFIIQVETLPVKIIVTYILMYYFVPKFLMHRKYLFFILIFLVLSGIAGVIQRLIIYYAIYPIYYPEHLLEIGPLNFIKLIKSLVNIYTVAAIAVLIKMIKQNYETQQERNQLNKEKLEAELKFLKSQIHPHFLFNTLNNLYALTLKKSDKAPEIVLKLSELLDYMLYECNAKTVDIDREINLINNFITLEKIRYGDRLNVELNISNNLQGIKVPPMLILPFIENAFKHGVSGEIVNPWVNIDISIIGKLLLVNVENSKEQKSVKDETGYTEGIGLNNVKRRLELLYKEKYELDIVDKGKAYLIVLKLKIND